jgi:resuscitation-promoting factor RpfB
VPYLHWVARLWTNRSLRARQVAKRYLATPHDTGYLPPAKALVLGQKMAALKGWKGEQWECLKHLWAKGVESGWYVYADNPHSSAYGIPQALPGSKMGKGWQNSAFVQIRWGLGYIAGRYGTPCGALSERLAKGWY